jgi:LysR family transcriptional regulator, transcriptional activator for dmlA
MNEGMHERDVVSGMAVFVSVVEGGSLAAAAKRTGLTPSAVSKLVTRLESSFGAPLLRRTTRSMTVTDAGLMFFERARVILEDLRGLEHEMATANSAARGTVRVSASQLLGQARVVPILLEFLASMPAIKLELELTDRVVDLVAERVDVAIRITSQPPPSFIARRVGSIRRVVCASPAYLRAASTPKVLSDLKAHNCLTFLDTSADTWQFGAKDDGTAKATLRVAGRLRVANTLSLYEAAKAGLGLAQLPHYLVESDLKARRLVAVLERFETPERGVFIVYPTGKYIPARVRAVVSHLVAALPKVLT